MSELRKAIESMERAKKALETEVAPAVDPIGELRCWRLAAGVRFVGKSLHVKERK